MKVLVAVDGSAYTDRVIEYLERHDWLSGAHDLTFLTVVLALPHRAAAFNGNAMTQRYYEDDAEQVLRPLRLRLDKLGVRASLLHEIGNPAEWIARHATQGQFDLIVMGSHGHGTFVNLVLGSVANKVLAACKTPVLIIR
jgi:nucleotide-binding universal stress UspA family protein